MSSISALLACLGAGMPCVAQPIGCIPPIRPFVPSNPHDVQAYADLLRQDFEAYIADFGTYLRCLDAERARVFEEGQEVTQEYGRLQALTARLRPSESAD
jgi:hypothetical protein